VSDHTTSIFRKVKVKRKKRSISDKCPDPEAHEKGDLLLPCDHFGKPLTDTDRLNWMMTAPHDDIYIRYAKGVPFIDMDRESIDAAIRASRASRKEK
jgi:hypothetical protein